MAPRTSPGHPPEVQRIEAQTKAETQRVEAQAGADARRLAAQSEAEAQALHTSAEVQALRAQEQAAQAYSTHPALLRLRELETLRELGRNSNARLYVDLRGAAQRIDATD